MTTTTGSLDNIAIAAPCTADWDQMQGDERVRFCAECKLNVFNLSGMGRSEAEELVRNRQQGRQQGRLCVRFYRRPDGTVLTSNCPVGMAALRQRVARRLARTGAVLGMLLASLVGCSKRDGANGGGDTPITQTPAQVSPPVDPAPLMGEVICEQPVMGRIAAPPEDKSKPEPR